MVALKRTTTPGHVATCPAVSARSDLLVAAEIVAAVAVAAAHHLRMTVVLFLVLGQAGKQQQVRQRHNP